MARDTILFDLHLQFYMKWVIPIYNNATPCSMRHVTCVLRECVTLFYNTEDEELVGHGLDGQRKVWIDVAIKWLRVGQVQIPINGFTSGGVNEDKARFYANFVDIYIYGLLRLWALVW